MRQQWNNRHIQVLLYVTSGSSITIICLIYLSTLKVCGSVFKKYFPGVLYSLNCSQVTHLLDDWMSQWGNILQGGKKIQNFAQRWAYLKICISGGNTLTACPFYSSWHISDKCCNLLPSAGNLGFQTLGVTHRLRIAGLAPRRSRLVHETTWQYWRMTQHGKQLHKMIRKFC